MAYASRSTTLIMGTAVPGQVRGRVPVRFADSRFAFFHDGVPTAWPFDKDTPSIGWAFHDGLSLDTLRPCW